MLYSSTYKGAEHITNYMLYDFETEFKKRLAEILPDKIWTEAPLVGGISNEAHMWNKCIDEIKKRAGI